MHADTPLDLRRTVIKVATLLALVGYGLAPRQARGATPFEATSMRDLLRALGDEPAPGVAIDLDLPEVWENGAMVPVTVASRIPGTEQILILVEANPYPLVARFEIGAGTEPFVATRVKLAQSGAVTAVVKADGRLYSVARNTTITVGGCGA